MKYNKANNCATNTKKIVENCIHLQKIYQNCNEKTPYPCITNTLSNCRWRCILKPLAKTHSWKQNMTKRIAWAISMHHSILSTLAYSADMLAILKHFFSLPTLPLFLPCLDFCFQCALLLELLSWPEWQKRQKLRWQPTSRSPRQSIPKERLPGGDLECLL